jgi:hypothetical protein
MRIPNAEHESRPWRIHAIVPDFTLEDVWALPAVGRAEDFHTVLELMTSADPANLESRLARFLWNLRDLLGEWFDLGRISTGAGVGADAGGRFTWVARMTKRPAPPGAWQERLPQWRPE